MSNYEVFCVTIKKVIIMKTKKTLILFLTAIICITQLSCKKNKDSDEPVPETKQYLPATILVQNGNTAATIHNITFDYNADGSLSSINQVISSATINWTFNYNQNGTLNTASYSHSTSGNILFSLSYDGNDRLNKVDKNDGTSDVLNLNYLAGSNTYVGSGGDLDGVRIKLNSDKQMENMQNWIFGTDISIAYQNSEKGIFADVNLDESVRVFLNLYNGYHMTHSFYHSKQLSSVVYGTNTYIFQNYNKNDNGYISSYQRVNAPDVPRDYSVTYKEQ